MNTLFSKLEISFKVERKESKQCYCLCLNSMLGYLNARQPKGPLRNSQHLPLGSLARSGLEVKTTIFFHFVFFFIYHVHVFT